MKGSGSFITGVVIAVFIVTFQIAAIAIPLLNGHSDGS